MVVFALTLSDLIERGGAYAGLAAFFGLAVLTILYFAQAREIRRLRDWAGRSPERAQELEERVVAQAEARSGVKAPPIRRPGQPATVAAKAAAATTSTAPPAAAQATADADAPPAEEGSATEHEVVKPAADPVVADAGSPSEMGAGDEAPVSDEETGADAEADENAAATDEPAGVPAGVAAAAPTGSSAATADAPTTITPAPDATPGPALPARATQGPAPSTPSVRRPGQAAAPLRSTPPAVRRPVPPPRRPGPPPPLRRDENAPRRRTGIIAAGALAGVTLIVVGLIALLGGGDDSPSTASEDPVPTVAATTDTETGGNGNGDPAEEETPSAGAPERADTAVAVLNGTAVSGLAGDLDRQLIEAGYTQAQAPTNWVDQTRSASIVFYSSSEYREQAIEIADQLDIADRQPIDDTALSLAPDANVVVLVGADQTP